MDAIECQMDRIWDGQMVTECVQNVDHCERWQHAYRFGVILILPPEPLRTQVNDLRSRHDPRSQAYCDGHISLLSVSHLRTLRLNSPVSFQNSSNFA
jgi:hypothetical protein